MIYIACALHCEAKPLIEFYKLKLDRNALYPVFSNHSMSLIVAGIGKQEMASAVSYLFARCGEVKNAAWLNLGIAGHASHAPGTFLNINKVHDAVCGKSWYPNRLKNNKEECCELISVDMPDSIYPETAAVDMEASAFMNIVQRYTLVDLSQVVKIVSDNSAADIERIDKVFVTELVRSNLPKIDNVVQSLLQQQSLYADIYIEPDLFQESLSVWRFTEYQQKDLVKKLEKARALNLSLKQEDFADCGNAGEMLEKLQHRLSSAVIDF